MALSIFTILFPHQEIKSEFTKSPSELPQMFKYIFFVSQGTSNLGLLFVFLYNVFFELNFQLWKEGMKRLRANIWSIFFWRTQRNTSE